MEQQNTLSVEGLRKRYGKKYAVRHVDFGMSQGEVVGLLGPNGAGKTTSFYMITGLIRPTTVTSPLALYMQYKVKLAEKKYLRPEVRKLTDEINDNSNVLGMIKEVANIVEGIKINHELFKLQLEMLKAPSMPPLIQKFRDLIYVGAKVARDKEPIVKLFNYIEQGFDDTMQQAILRRLIQYITESRIYLNRENIIDMPMYQRARRGIGYLAQEASIFRKMTVEQNLLAILETMDLTPEQIQERKNELIDDFFKDKISKEREQLLQEAEHLHDPEERDKRIAAIDKMQGYEIIEPFLKQKAFSLSGGERRRAEIARALCAQPAFLLLDEPFAGIDPIAVMDIQGIIRQLKERGLGILITDHNVRETLKITDRSYIMYDGKILISGAVNELLNNEEARKVYLGEDFQM